MRSIGYLARRATILFALLIATTSCVDRKVRSDVRQLSLRVDSMAVTLTDLLAAYSKSISGGATADPDSASIPIRGGVSLGSPTAPVIVVEFADYECPFCRRHAVETFPQLKREFVESGRIRYIVRDNPLPFHKAALLAAIAARCALAQGLAEYWNYHDALFAHEGGLGRPVLVELGAKSGLDLNQWSECLESEAPALAVAEDQEVAQGAGLTGTPAFVVGTAEGSEVRGITIRGAQPLHVFSRAIIAAEAVVSPRE